MLYYTRIDTTKPYCSKHLIIGTLCLPLSQFGQVKTNSSIRRLGEQSLLSGQSSFSHVITSTKRTLFVILKPYEHTIQMEPVTITYKIIGAKYVSQDIQSGESRMYNIDLTMTARALTGMKRFSKSRFVPQF